MRLFFFAALLACLFQPALRAQSLPSLEQAGSLPGAYYEFAQPGDVTVMVKVWGTVSNPGLYEVRDGTHLSTLFTLAGGPLVTVRNPETHHTLQVRLSRAEAGGRRVVYEERMEDGIFAFEEDPVLQEGDVLLVEAFTRTPFQLRELLPFITTGATLVLLLDRFF